MFLTKQRRRLLGSVAAVPLTIVLLGACGGGTDGGGTADTGKPTAKTKSFEDWQLAFSTCMRDEGIDFPDPGKGGLAVTESQDASEMAALEKASTKCRGTLGDPPPVPGMENKTDEQLQEDALKSAKCFRDNGVDVPDPGKGVIGLTVPQDAPKDVVAKCASGGNADMGGVRPNG
ncbi:hypothetical protein [Streptomyces sp. NPDC088910]|uniref:hypothetical protein n=1 Tax=Streptomyces sp. NPDC088910 TaxID=3365911 RepID=UPI0037F3F820